MTNWFFTLFILFIAFSTSICATKVKLYLVFLFNRQEAAGALWNLSFDDRNREAIAAAGGVEALV